MSAFRKLAHAVRAAVLLSLLPMTVAAQPMTLRYFAGAPSMSGPDGAAADARLQFGYGNTIARDAAGNLYISSTDSTIRRLSPAGEVTTIAGLWGSSGWADGVGAQARFSNPYGIALDDAGNLYVADAGNQVIRMITLSSHAVTTIAGAPGVAQSVDGSIAAARFNDPRGVIVDHNGVIYVAEYGTGKIRKIANGTVSTVATDFGVQGMAVDTSNNVIVADQMKVSRMAPNGTLTVIAGAFTRGFADGPGTAAKFDTIQGLTADAAGSVMYVTDQWNGRIRKITSAGVVTTVAGANIGPPVDGTGSAAHFSLSVAGIVLDAAHGELYVCDSNTIRKVTTAGVVTTVAGILQYASIDGPARSARFYRANGIALDSLGNLYVAEKDSYRIRRVSPAGDVTTVAGSGSPGDANGTGSAAMFASPYAVAVDGNDNAYVTDGAAIRKVTPAGVVTTLAGVVYSSGSVDGTGSAARFNSPYGIAFSAPCNCLYVADNGNHTVRKVLLDGTVTTFAGRSGVQGSTNGTGSGATFTGPSYLAADANGNLYCPEGHSVRKITPAAVVTTYAGTSYTSGEVDGSAAAALFNTPDGLACDDAGNVYVADFWGPTIRKITPAGAVSTIVGRGGVYGYSMEGTGGSAQMLEPNWLAADHSGNLYLVEYDGHTIDKITPSLPDTATVASISGALGLTRQLDALPRTASTWRWDLVRRPTGSTATLSAANIANPLFTPDVSDTFTFRVTAENAGATSVTDVSLTAACDPAPPSITITSGSNPSCAATPVTLDAGAWSTYSWSTGDTTRTITVTPAVTTTYSVTVVDGYGCTKPQASRTITVTPALSSVAVTGAGSASACAGGTGGTFTAQATGGGVVTYQWGYRTVSGGSITDLATATGASYTLAASDFPAAGNYLLVCRAVPQCGTQQVSNESSVTIQPQVVVPAITPSGPLTFCAGGSVTLSAPAGYASYAWSNGATTQSIVVTASGSFSVTVTGAGGCSATSAASAVTVNPVPAPHIVAAQQYTSLASSGFVLGRVTAASTYTYCGDATVGLFATGGGTNSQYHWNTGEQTASIRVTQSGVYTVTMTNAEGCSADDSVTIEINPIPTATITAGGPLDLCPNGGSVVLTANVADSYLWSTGETTRAISVTQPGAYHVAITTGGCSATSNDVTVTRRTIGAITGGGTFCPGGSVALTAPAGSSYAWSTGATTQSITVSAAGDYSVTVTDATGCAMTPPPATVTASTLAVSVSQSATSICEGQTSTLTANTTGGTGSYSYQWFDGSDSIQGATSASYSASASGAYSVAVTDASACSTTSQPVSVMVNPLPDASISAQSNACAGTTYAATSTAGAASYQWTIANGTIVDGQGTNAIHYTSGPSGSVTLTLAVATAQGCADTKSRTIPIANVQASITPAGPLTICPGGSVTLTANAGASYLWSNNATAQSITVSQAGAYSVQVFDANGCSAQSQSVSVAVASPSATITPSGPTNFCAGGSVTLSAPAGYASYAWSNGASTQSITVNQSNTYSVTVSDANGCTASSSTSVTVNPLPQVAFSTPAAICGTSETAQEVQPLGTGLTYNWSITNGAVTQNAGHRVYFTASTGASQVVLTVTITDANGCSNSGSITLPVHTPPSAAITPSGPATFCAGESVTLTAPAGMSSYAWSTGATTQSITVSATGSYSVTVTDANFCSTQSSPFAVTVNPLPAPAISASGGTTFCAGGSVTLTATAGYSSYLWNTGATTQSITVSSSNNYSVTVRDGNNCSGTSAPTAVSVRPVPTATVSGSAAICPGGSATITAALTGTAPWSVVWSDNLPQTINSGTTATRSVSPQSTTTYTVVSVSDANACSRAGSGSAVVTVKSLPTATVSGGGTICPGASATIVAALTGTAPWSVTWSDNVVQNIPGGSGASRNVSPASTTTYTVTSVTDANGCPHAGAGSATVTVNPAASITTQPSNVTTTRNTNITLSVAAAGTTPISYQWFNGNGTSISGATSSSYTTSFSKKGTNTFYVEVWNACNTTHVRSNTVTVTVN
ncbi:MAG: hypothetical protein JO093_09085 [Acidobacteria bacterium]|nr:hypothetical protein [Acidobacteriota bacterium]